ncbi:putative pectinesterase [Helianthus annuus]|nr:putative pectinesterase [Helianthus annuus]KAJ0551729.1 putative pectinesterase [Helianthus annuus]KAJ0551736.1 putative pectinesterase [Helianthus annuus]KAJ0564689.1 putative pectinesterase [Helianthus annuus]KAJ0732726.1 putative pectinesterase [Helianthus annuus]
MKVTLFLCFISLLLSFSSKPTTVTAAVTVGSITWRCRQTPHYKTCNHYVARRYSFTAPITAKQFLDMTIQSAIDEARAACNKTRAIKSTYPNVRGKSLWGSCVDYFDRTAFTLNMVLNPHHDLQPTPLDVQTWLSAGLTYITVCHKGFELINMTNTMLHVITTSLTELIVSSLAISVTFPSCNTNGLGNVNFSDEYKLADLAKEKPDVVVAQHGSGDFKSIQKAVDYAMIHRMPKKRFVIYVKAGIYKEYVEIPETVKYITMYGDGINKTIITGNRHCGEVWSRKFIARGITFRNTAGPQGGQALAVLSSSDKSTFYRCSFEGYQDTLLTMAYTQFYKECQIFGTVDFIFGSARAVFQDCSIFFRKPLPGGGLVVTAHGRNNDYEPTGYSLQGCKVTAAPELNPSEYAKAFLGRPWFGLSRTVYMQSFLDGLVDPQGWLDSWGHKDTAYCAEYKHYGPGSSTNQRVNWPHYHAITDPKTAKFFTVAHFISGYNWLPKTGVPFTPGFKNLSVLLN